MGALYDFATTLIFYVTPYQLLWCVLNPVVVLLLLRALGLASSPPVALTSALATGFAVLSGTGPSPSTTRPST